MNKKKESEKVIRSNWRVTKEQLKAIKNLAKRRGESESQVIRDILEQFLKWLSNLSTAYSASYATANTTLLYIPEWLQV